MERVFNYSGGEQLNDIMLTQRFAYTSGGLTEYIGYAKPGSLTSDDVWMICKYAYNTSNQATSKTWADGSNSQNKIWDIRDTYTYS